MYGGSRCNTYMFSFQQDIYTAGDERPEPSAPTKTAKVKVKVEWDGQFPDRWPQSLQKALQTWCNSDLPKDIRQYDVFKVTTMADDPRIAEVQIKPFEGKTL